MRERESEKNLWGTWEGEHAGEENKEKAYACLVGFTAREIKMMKEVEGI